MYGLPYADFREAHKCSTALCIEFLYRILSKAHKKKVEHKNKTSTTPSNKVWFSLHRFSQNSQVLKAIKRKSSIPNFTKIGNEIWTLRTENNVKL
jgi:hypothetical protein